MTEDEAKTKWCPMVRNAMGSIDVALNRNSESNNCIGSACAMWRWHPGAGAQYLTKDQMEERSKRGFCGLAGKV